MWTAKAHGGDHFLVPACLQQLCQRLQFVLVSRFYLGCLPELKTKCPSSLHLVQPCAYVLDMDTGACDTLELCPPFPPPAS